MKLRVTKEVSKETYELCLALADLITKTKVALEDGWQVGRDLPVVMTAVVQNIGEIIEGLNAAKGEFEADPDAFLAAIAVGVAEVTKAVR